MAIIDAFRALADASSHGRTRRGRAVPFRNVAPNKALHPTRPSRALGSRG
jgi:hypothetical protein